MVWEHAMPQDRVQVLPCGWLQDYVFELERPVHFAVSREARWVAARQTARVQIWDHSLGRGVGPDFMPGKGIVTWFVGGRDVLLLRPCSQGRQCAEQRALLRAAETVAVEEEEVLAPLAGPLLLCDLLARGELPLARTVAVITNHLTPAPHTIFPKPMHRYRPGALVELEGQQMLDFRRIAYLQSVWASRGSGVMTNFEGTDIKPICPDQWWVQEALPAIKRKIRAWMVIRTPLPDGLCAEAMEEVRARRDERIKRRLERMPQFVRFLHVKDWFFDDYRNRMQESGAAYAAYMSSTLGIARATQGNEEAFGRNWQLKRPVRGVWTYIPSPKRR
jgi:hypothetical protein